MTHSPKIADCLKVVEEAFGVTRGDLLSARRGREVARPRQVAYWLAKKVTLHSLPEIGRAIGGRHHTTIMAGVKRVEIIRAMDAEFSSLTDSLLSRLTGEPDHAGTSEGMAP